MSKIFRLYPIRFSLITLAFIVFLSYGQATKFALWQDDNALIFKLQHLDEAAGFFGPGPFGIGAYRYIAIPYIPIYELFGVNIQVFYIWAVFFYFLASVSIFFLARQITGNNLIAFLSGSIFSAGYVGSDGILRLFNSIQTSYSIIFVATTFFFLYGFIQVKKWYYYIVALVFYFLSLETAFIRTQYLILPTILFFLIFLFNWRKVVGILRGFVLTLPFLFIYYFLLAKYPDPRSIVVLEFIRGILSGTIQYTHNFFGSIGNVVLPNPLSEFLFVKVSIITQDLTNKSILLEAIFFGFFIFLLNLILKKEKILLRIIFIFLEIAWFAVQWAFFHDSELLIRHSLDKHAQNVFSNFIGGSFLIICLAAIFIILKKNKKIGFSIISLLFWMFSNILAFSTYLPFTPPETINRYLTHSLAAYSLALPIILYWILVFFFPKKVSQKISAIIVILFTITNIGLSINYQQRFVTEKSNPTKRFYRDLKTFLPEIPKGSILYFDVADDRVSQQQFLDSFSVAQMPDTTAIAIRYGIDTYDFYMTRDFGEMIDTLEETGISINSIFSFFYKNGQLVDTTQTLRKHLTEGGPSFNFSEIDGPPVGIPIVTPIVAQVTARASLPKTLRDFSCITQVTKEERRLFFDYFISRDNLRQRIKVDTSSEEKNRRSSLLTDGDVSTLWRGNRGWWHENRKEIIRVDLGDSVEIGKFIWINGYANSSPIDYDIVGSIDRKAWKEIKKVNSSSKKGNGKAIIESFPPTKVRYLQMTITKTFDNDSPAIGEVEVVERDFINIDRNKAERLEQNLTDCLEDKDDLYTLQNFLKRRGVKAFFVWKTNKHEGWGKDNVRSFFIMPNGLYHKHKVLLPPGGTLLETLKVEPENLSIEVHISNIKLFFPNREELKYRFGIKPMVLF